MVESGNVKALLRSHRSSCSHDWNRHRVWHLFSTTSCDGGVVLEPQPVSSKPSRGRRRETIKNLYLLCRNAVVVLSCANYVSIVTGVRPHKKVPSLSTYREFLSRFNCPQDAQRGEKDGGGEEAKPLIGLINGCHLPAPLAQLPAERTRLCLRLPPECACCKQNQNRLDG